MLALCAFVSCVSRLLNDPDPPVNILGRRTLHQAVSCINQQLGLVGHKMGGQHAADVACKVVVDVVPCFCTKAAIKPVGQDSLHSVRVHSVCRRCTLLHQGRQICICLLHS
ncbi:hypothetical protein BC831DRAFT_442144 [Entophlyctis helioformis]|nr:hypothetical protein BC831DRAFT_442144 [Entophlyctis helioformis]